MQIENQETENSPAISIILPVYNGGSYLVSSVESVLSQSLKNFELLIVDDCSTDGSREYISSITDTRVIIYKNEKNKGLFYNLNFLIGKCNSNLIKLWTQDDIMYPVCLQAFVNFHEQHPAIGFSYSGRDMIDENGQVKKNKRKDDTSAIISTDLHAKIAFFTGSIAGNISNVCLSRPALDKVGLFNEDMKISADFDMWVRLAKDYETGFISNALIQLRDHPGQLSMDNRFYINHVREDMVIYRNLLSYVAPSLKKEGRQLLRKHKFVFYYTLMLKEILKGNIKTAWLFYKELSGMDNFIKLSFSFIKEKFLKPSKPPF